MRLLPPVLLLTACSATFAPDTGTPLQTLGTPSTTGGGSTGPTSTPTDPTSTGTTTTPTGTTTTTTTTGGDTCPPGVTCVEALPFVDRSTTTGEVAALDHYSCAPSTNESGPERVYRVELADEGFLAASLSGLGAGVDVDVHVLEELDAGRCVDRGHWDAGALIAAGTYWIVVDSWVDASGDSKDGAYTLELGHTTSADWQFEGLQPDALDAAIHAFDVAWRRGETDRLSYGIVDFSLPSDEPRLFVLDLATQELALEELVSHGSGSQDPTDNRYADRFSNVSGSNMSSLGLAVGAETYQGTHGYSLRMDGLDPGFNDNIRDRAIVVHNADYATQDFVDTYGYLGRSNGCWAVDPAISADFIDLLAEGGALFTYYPDPSFLAASDHLQGL